MPNPIMAIISSIIFKGKRFLKVTFYLHRRLIRDAKPKKRQETTVKRGKEKEEEMGTTQDEMGTE